METTLKQGDTKETLKKVMVEVIKIMVTYLCVSFICTIFIAGSFSLLNIGSVALDMQNPYLESELIYLSGTILKLVHDLVKFVMALMAIVGIIFIIIMKYMVKKPFEIDVTRISKCTKKCIVYTYACLVTLFASVGLMNFDGNMIFNLWLETFI